jgi:hypothetical protein
MITTVALMYSDAYVYFGYIYADHTMLRINGIY